MKSDLLTNLYENFIDTFNFCGSELLNAENSQIEHYIFEEFDISVHTFLFAENLKLLRDNNFINLEIFDESLKLRELVIEMQKNGLWKLEFVKDKAEWKHMFELSDKIKYLIKFNPTAKQS